MEVKATARYLRVSPKKVRLVIDVVRGMDVEKALIQLQALRKDSTKYVIKLLNSAIANAEHNDELKRENLYIKKITADGGPILHRWRPRAHGRAGAIRKRTSHITIVLDERVPTEKKADKKGKKTAKSKEVKKEDKKPAPKKAEKPVKEAKPKKEVKKEDKPKTKQAK